MGATDQDVKVGLTIQEDGEPKAFSEAAESVSELASKSADAAPSLATLADALGALGTAAEGTAEAKQAVVDFSRAVKDFESAGGLDEQKAAVDAMLDAWKRLGEEVPDVLDKSKQAAKDYQATLDKLLDVQAKLGDPVAESLSKAEAAFDKLGQAVENSLGTAGKKLAEAKQRIDDYAKALADAKKAGQDVAAGQVQELQRLQQGYAAAEQAVAKYSATKKQVARQLETDRAATDGEVKSITSLKDLVTEAVPTWGKYAGAAAAVVGAFEAGYAAGTKLHEVLNLLSGGDFDRQVQGYLHLQAAAEAATNAIEGEVGAEELANQRRIFLAKGLQGFSLDVEKNRAVIDQLAKSQNDLRGRQEELAASTRKLAEAHNVDTVALGKQAKALEAAILAFERQNKQLTSIQIGKIFKDSLQPILDGYERLGKEAPENLKRLAAQWDVTTSAADKHRAAVAKILEQITGIAVKSKVELAQAAKDLEDAFSHINIGKLNFEQFTRARKEVQDLVDAYSLAGEHIPASLQKIATEVQVFQSEADVMAHKVTNAATGMDKLRDSTDKTAAAVGAAAANTDKLATSTGNLADSESKAAAAAAAHLEVTKQTTQVFDESGQEISRVTKNIITNAGAHAEAAAAEQTHLEVTKKTTQVFDENGQEISRITKNVITSTAATNEATTSADKHTEATKEEAKGTLDLTKASNDLVLGVQKVKEGTVDLSKASNDLVVNVEKVKDGLSTFGDKLGTAADSMKQVADRAADFNKVKFDVQPKVEELSKLEKALLNLPVLMKGLFDGLFSDLDKLQQKVAQTTAAVNQLASGGAAASGEEPS